MITIQEEILLRLTISEQLTKILFTYKYRQTQKTKGVALRQCKMNTTLQP